MSVLVRIITPLLLGVSFLSVGCSGGGSAQREGAADGSGEDDDREDREQTGTARGDGGSGDADADGGSASAPADGGSGGMTPVSFVPTFPGAPQSQAGQPLEGGKLCDSVPGATVETVSNVTRCFFGQGGGGNTPAATIEQVLECVDDAQTLHLRLTFNPNFNDNTYGKGSIGWPHVRGHRFRDLVGSDHAELKLVDGDGEVAMQFKLDYIEKDDTAASGYATQCTDGGDGNITVGDRAHLIDCTTSLDENLNARGYVEYTQDSPVTDADYSVNSDAPEWDYRMVFEVWVDVEAFGDAGFAGAFIDYVHASPAKEDEETIEVTPDECPPCEPLPDYTCDDTPPPPEDPPAYCDMYPTDPDCVII